MSTDFDEIRKYAGTGERPDDWPEEVYSIGLDTLSLLGVHAMDNTLFWDGKEIVTRTVVRLGSKELWLAGIASFSTLGMFVLALGEAAGWF